MGPYHPYSRHVAWAQISVEELRCYGIRLPAFWKDDKVTGGSDLSTSDYEDFTWIGFESIWAWFYGITMIFLWETCADSNETAMIEGEEHDELENIKKSAEQGQPYALKMMKRLNIDVRVSQYSQKDIEVLGGLAADILLYDLRVVF